MYCTLVFPVTQFAFTLITPSNLLKTCSSRYPSRSSLIFLTSSSASPTAMPYPAFSILVTISAIFVISGSYSTAALSVVRLTFAKFTPDNFFIFLSTAVAQLAQSIPVIGKLVNLISDIFPQCTWLIFSSVYSR